MVVTSRKRSQIYEEKTTILLTCQIMGLPRQCVKIKCLSHLTDLTHVSKVPWYLIHLPTSKVLSQISLKVPTCGVSICNRMVRLLQQYTLGFTGFSQTYRLASPKATHTYLQKCNHIGT